MAIGRVYHEDPQVLALWQGRGTGLELTTGMTFTIEPMINAGRRDVRLLPDGWTVGHQRPIAVSAVGAYNPRDRPSVSRCSR